MYGVHIIFMIVIRITHTRVLAHLSTYFFYVNDKLRVVNAGTFDF